MELEVYTMISNKTLIIVIAGVIGVSALYLGEKDICIAALSGLLGYLSKDLVPSNETGDEDDQGA